VFSQGRSLASSIFVSGWGPSRRMIVRGSAPDPENSAANGADPGVQYPPRARRRRRVIEAGQRHQAAPLSTLKPLEAPCTASWRYDAGNGWTTRRMTDRGSAPDVGQHSVRASMLSAAPSPTWSQICSREPVESRGYMLQIKVERPPIPASRKRAVDSG